MEASQISLDEIRKMAAEVGLTRLTEEHLAQLARATAVTFSRRSAMQAITLTPADEPALMLRLSGRDA